MESDFRGVLVGFAAFLTIMISLVWALGNTHIEIKESNANIARCKSLQGEYGGGKCFKNGKEV